MLWGVFVGFALARDFFAPAPPVANAPPAFLASRPATQPQPQMIEVQMPQYVAPESSGYSTPFNVAVLLAGFAAGRQAMLFTGGSKSSPKAKPGGRPAPKKPAAKAAAKVPYERENRADNRGNPYGTRSNVQIQKSGFGNFVQKFQVASSEKKSKYGMPIFLKNGNINPAYLAAERKDMQAQSKVNSKQAEIKRKGLISSGAFELADYVRKKIGPVGSGEDYYQSGR